MLRRLAPLLLVTFYVGLTAWSLLGLFGQADAAVPGAGAGDNLAFVWNTWWMDRVLHTGAPFFFSPMLFAPLGVDLTLHTHTALPSLIAAAAGSGRSVVFGTNLAVGLHLFLNFVCAFALAWRVTRDVSASVLASVVFGWSPYVGAHLLGHFNLIGAWLLPLTALLLLRLDESPRLGGVALGVVLGAAAYVDYYYAVYALLLAAIVAAGRTLSMEWAGSAGVRGWQRRVLLGIGTLGALVLIVTMVIAMTGGAVIAVGSTRMSMLSAGNPVSLLGLLMLAGAAVAVVPRIRLRADPRGAVSALARFALPLAVSAILVAPLLIHAVGLWRQGDYVTQRYYWRSAPRGVDVATLLLGNPSGLLSHGVTARVYERLGIDAVEQGAWLGPGVMALCAVALAFRRTARHVHLWIAVAAVFGIWALGPSLMAFGHDTRTLLPTTLVRYLPVVANARIPSRAVVLVYLAAAVLCAVGVTELRRRGRSWVVAALAALVVIDYLPRPVPVFRLDRPAPYEALARRADGGTLCELPIGLRDGFAETGRFDARVLAYQTFHQHPITGGFVARLPPRILAAYERSPILGVLTRLSAGRPLAGEPVLSSADGGSALRAAGIRYLMLNRLTAPADLQQYVRTGLPLQVLSEDAERTLYEVVR